MSAEPPRRKKAARKGASMSPAGTARGQQRRLVAIRRWVAWPLAAFAVLMISAAVAWRQSPRPDAYATPAPLSLDWWRYPVERNAWLRLPSLTGSWRDVAATASGRVWIVGDNATILHSADHGVTWVKQEVPDLGTVPIGGPTKDPTRQVPPNTPMEESNKANKATGASILSPGATDSLAARILEEPNKAPAERPTKGSQPDPDISNMFEKGRPSNVANPSNMQANPPAPSTGDISKPPIEPEHPVEPRPSVRLPSLRAVYFVDDNHGWAAGEIGAIVRTQDGGRTWVRQSAGSEADINDVYFAHTGTGLIVREDGLILKTTDGGQSWRQTKAPYAEPLTRIALVDAQRGWALQVHGPILQTADGGETWEIAWRVRDNTDGDDFYYTDLLYRDAYQGWVVSNKGRILHTTDGGRSWKQQRAPTGGEERVYSIAFADAQHGWAAGGDGLILHTTNAGDSWTPQPSGVSWDLNTVTAVNASTAWVVGDGGVILRTTDAGASWSVLSVAPAVGDAHRPFVLDGQNIWLTDGTPNIRRTHDGGVTWSTNPTPADQSIRDVCFVDKLQGWGVTASGAVMKTGDGGRSWTTLAYLPRDAAAHVRFVTPQTGWAFGVDGAIFRTTDGGGRWTEPGVDEWQRVIASHFINETTGWALVEDGWIIHTTNAGDRWETQDPRDSGVGTVFKDLHFASATLGWAVGTGGAIAHTKDGGATWIPQTSNSVDNLVGVTFRDATTGYCVGYGGAVLGTTTGGDVWRPVTTPFDKTPTRLAAAHVDSDGVLSVIDVRGVVWRTSDGGATWERRTQNRRHPAPWFYAAMVASLLLNLPLFFRRGDDGKVLAAQEEASVSNVVISDAPLEPGQPDALSLGRIALGLSRFLRNVATMPPLTIAVTGPWGSGKSSLMNLLRGNLRSYGFCPVWFNAWHHQEETNVLAALLERIRREAIPPWHSESRLRLKLRLLMMRTLKRPVWSLLLFGLLGLCMGYLAFRPTERLDRAARFLSSAASDAAGMVERIMKGDAKAEADAAASGNVEGQSGTPPTGAAGKTEEAPRGLIEVGSLVGVAFALWRLRGAAMGLGLDPVKLLASAAGGGGAARGGPTADLSFRLRYQKQFEDMTNALRIQGRTMTIFIDDLDRCRSETVLTVLEAVNYLVTSGKCYVILGMDDQRVERFVAHAFREYEGILQRPGGERSEATPDGGDDAREKTAAPPGNKAPASTEDALFDFARQYMEKLINIIVPVPTATPEQMSKVAALDEDEKEPRVTWGQRIRRWGPAAALLAVYGVVFYASAFYGAAVGERGDGRRPAADTAKPAPLAATAEAGAGGEAAGAGAADRRGGDESQRAVFVPGERDARAWMSPSGLAGAGVLIIFGGIAAFLLLVVDPYVTDSKPFLKALRAWQQVVAARSNTPRSVKRFVNRVRYLAMLERRDEHGARRVIDRLRKKDGSAREQEPAGEGEHQVELVILGALHAADDRAFEGAVARCEAEEGADHWWDDYNESVRPVVRRAIDVVLSTDETWRLRLPSLDAARRFLMLLGVIQSRS